MGRSKTKTGSAIGAAFDNAQRLDCMRTPFGLKANAT